MESVKINDILTYRSLSGIRYSPDGKRAAFVVSNANDLPGWTTLISFSLPRARTRRKSAPRPGRNSPRIMYLT